MDLTYLMCLIYLIRLIYLMGLTHLMDLICLMGLIDLIGYALMQRRDLGVWHAFFLSFVYGNFSLLHQARVIF